MSSYIRKAYLWGIALLVLPLIVLTPLFWTLVFVVKIYAQGYRIHFKHLVGLWREFVGKI